MMAGRIARAPRKGKPRRGPGEIGHAPPVHPAYTPRAYEGAHGQGRGEGQSVRERPRRPFQNAQAGEQVDGVGILGEVVAEDEVAAQAV